MEDLKILPLELRKLGLNEKEAGVYLAALELGYTTIQKIAQKAKISRPTTYEVIKSLEQKGLIKESKDKGKRYFTAESPDNLLGILKIQKRELEEKEREFLRIIATLRDKYSLNDKKEIKKYKGKNELENLFENFLTTQSKEIYAIIGNEKTWPSKNRLANYEKIKSRLGKIKIKELSDNKTSYPDYLERKPLQQKTLKDNIIIYDKVIIFGEKSTGLLIENKTVINLIKSLFLYTWNK